MRLIDADALKDALVEAHINRVITFDIAQFRCFMDIIDKLDDGEKIERPQDKWGKWVISEIRCPICLEYFQTDCYSEEELKECPSCGADMRGCLGEKQSVYSLDKLKSFGDKESEKDMKGGAE